MAPMMNPAAGHGAIDLSALAQPAPEQPSGTYTVEVDEASFDSVARLSLQHPVVVEFYSPRAPEQEALSKDLRALADEAQGRWLLARLNVDTSPQLAAALQVQAVPTVIGLIDQKLVPLWQGTLSKAEAGAYVQELLRLAVQHGVVGRVSAAATAAAGDEPDPRYTAAYEAMGREDYAAAAAEFGRLLATDPDDAEAKVGAPQAGLLSRAARLDPTAVGTRLAADPTDLDAVLDAADIDLATGDAAKAFARLIEAVRATAGDERDTVRKRLLELFDTLPPADPTVLKARRDLATALF